MDGMKKVKEIKKIFELDLKNIEEKMKKGKPLTVAERARLESQLSGEVISSPYAKNFVELAKILGVSRQTIDKWKSDKNAPKPLSNGLHDVSKWKVFVKENKKSLLSQQESNSPELDLRARKMLAEVEEKEIRLSILRGQFLPVEKVRSTWSAQIGQVRNLLESRLLNELPPILSAMEPLEIREKMQEVLDEIYKILFDKMTNLKDN